MIRQVISNNLKDLQLIISQMDDNEYTLKHEMMENASLGQHVRHILEMFECLVNGYTTGVVNYDLRKRSLQIETDRKYSMALIDRLTIQLQMEDKTLKLIALADVSNEFELQTTYIRELLYNLEHMIHHEAIMKRGLLTCKNVTLDGRFGYAPSTIKFQNQTAKGGTK